MALDIAAIEERAYHRRLEEICEMQDKAIDALKQANKALELALAALERNRNEQGFKQHIPWQNTYPGQQPYYLYSDPNYAGTAWGGSNTLGLQQNSQNYQAGIATSVYVSDQPIVVDWNVKDNNVNEVNSGLKAYSGALQGSAK